MAEVWWNQPRLASMSSFLSLKAPEYLRAVDVVLETARVKKISASGLPTTRGSTRPVNGLMAMVP